MAEVYGFRNEPSGSGREQHWNAAELFARTIIGLQRAAAQVDGVAGGLGVTAWGVDVGLIDNNNDCRPPISTKAQRSPRLHSPCSIV